MRDCAMPSARVDSSIISCLATEISSIMFSEACGIVKSELLQRLNSFEAHTRTHVHRIGAAAKASWEMHSPSCLTPCLATGSLRGESTWVLEAMHHPGNPDARREMRAVMLGLDAAGKTTILYKLHIGEIL